MSKIGDLRRFKGFWGIIPLILSFLLLCVNLVQAGDFWGSLSVRSPYIQPNPADFELAFGGTSPNSSFEIMRERENGRYYNGSDIQFKYTEFKFQHFLKEAVNIEYTKATWSRRLPIKKVDIRTGGSIHSDLTINETKILAVVSLKYKKLKMNFEHSGEGYYLFSVDWKGKVAKGFYPKFTYRDVNGNKYYWLKMVYSFKL